MECKFCNIDKKDILWENNRVFVILGRPHHKGHLEVVLKDHKESFEEIDKELAKEFFYDALIVARKVNRVLSPDKMNYELLGNWVPHLHWHIIPRFRQDKDFGNPPEIPRKNEVFEKKEMTEKEINSLKKELKNS